MKAKGWGLKGGFKKNVIYFVFKKDISEPLSIFCCLQGKFGSCLHCRCKTLICKEKLSLEAILLSPGRTNLEPTSLAFQKKKKNQQGRGPEGRRVAAVGRGRGEIILQKRKVSPLLSCSWNIQGRR